MHLFFYARGTEVLIPLWKMVIQSNFWRWKRRNLETNEEEEVLVQGVLRPSFLGAWEYIFPKEALPEVLAVLGVEECFLNDVRLKMLGKLFNARPVPKDAWELSKTIPTSHVLKDSQRGLSHSKIQGVNLHILGIKDDPMVELGGYYQEAL